MSSPNVYEPSRWTEPSPCQQHVKTAAGCLMVISMLAALIIGSVAAAGHFPGSALGWTAVGLGGGVLAGKLLEGGFKNEKVLILVVSAMAIALIALGACGHLKLLSVKQVGFGMLGTMLIPLTFEMGRLSYHARHDRIQASYELFE